MLQIPVCISRIVSGQLTAASRCLSCHGCHQSCQSVPSPSYSYRLSLPTWALGLPFLLGIAFGASSRDAMRCSPQWSLTARGSFTLPVGAVEGNLWLWRTLGGLLRSQLLPSCVFWRHTVLSISDWTYILRIIIPSFTHHQSLFTALSVLIFPPFSPRTLYPQAVTSRTETSKFVMTNIGFIRTFHERNFENMVSAGGSCCPGGSVISFEAHLRTF